MTTPSIESLWDMLELNANSFLSATTQLARLHALVSGVTDKGELLLDGTVTLVGSGLDDFVNEARPLGARLAAIAAERLKEQIEAKPSNVTIGDLARRLNEIESRFGDHLLSVKMFALSEMESVYLSTGSDLLGQMICDRFPSVIFEMEEAAKCVALGRSTAAVFHCMRALEPAIRALATFLELPDPTKPYEKNWGHVLGEIQKKLDEKFPKNQRLAGTDGAIVEGIYVTLDAIKNPWRNATMHAEATYQPHEASHIVQCVNVLLMKMAAFIDETGTKV